MVAPALRNAIRVALRIHEIGHGTPYRLCFARKGKSGASFGFMQGDLAAGQQETREAFCSCLAHANYSQAEIQSLLAKLSVPCPINPLSTEETEGINAALEAAKATVDAMDETIFAKVEQQVDHCIATAQPAQRTISDEALIYIALWINMTGAPTELLRWLRGEKPRIQHDAPPADNPVSAKAIQDYLRASYYYTENPGNFAHMRECVAEGMKALKAPPLLRR